MTVTEDPSKPITNIDVEKHEITLHPGETYQMEVQFIPPDTLQDKTLTYESRGIAIAEVDSDGLITAGRIGETMVIARTADGKFSTHIVVEVVADETPIPGVDIPDEKIIVNEDFEQRFNNEFIRLINIERGKNEVGLAEYNENLEKYAMKRAEQISGVDENGHSMFRHDECDKSYCLDVIMCGPALSGKAPEDYARMAVESFSSSPSHWNWLTHQSATEGATNYWIGVGVYFDYDGWDNEMFVSGCFVYKSATAPQTHD